MKKLIYNNHDISNSVRLLDAQINDNSGGILDSLYIKISDIEKTWRNYPPDKNDVLNLQYDGFDSGIMFLDEYMYVKGAVILKAISAPLNSKDNKNKSWENIRFKKLANDLMKDLNLECIFYNITDFLYYRLDQSNKTNLQFLNEICSLEGYNLKITNNKAIIFNEKYFESTNIINEFSEKDFIGDYKFKCKNSNIFSKCTLRTADKIVSHKALNLHASELNLNNIDFRTEDEGKRFSENILRNFNKYEFTGTFNIHLQPIASGNTIKINSMGNFSGKYFVDSVKHNLTKQTSSLFVRKVLKYD